MINNLYKKIYNIKKKVKILTILAKKIWIILFNNLNKNKK